MTDRGLGAHSPRACPGARTQLDGRFGPDPSSVTGGGHPGAVAAFDRDRNTDRVDYQLLMRSPIQLVHDREQLEALVARLWTPQVLDSHWVGLLPTS